MRSIKSVAVLAVAVLATAGLAVVAAPAANAATGSALLSPATGNATTTRPTLTTPACSAGTTSTSVYVSGGPSNWAVNSFVWKGPSDTGLNNTVAGFAADNQLTLQTTNGTNNYVITAYCNNDLGDALDTFTGQFSVDTAANSGNGSYTMVDNRPTVTPATVVANPTSTTTGSNVVLTTTVSVSSGTTAGSVQFKADGANVGSAVNLTGIGATAVTASQTVTFASAGSKAITATFTPTGTDVVGGTSAATTVTISGPAAPAANTSLTLAGSAASITTLQNAVLTATATNLGTPAGSTTGTPTGTVTFTNGTTTLGTAALDSTGKATLTVAGATLGVGSYSIGASLAASASFNASTATAVPLAVTQATDAFTTQPGPQTIQTNVVAGTITLTGGVTTASGAVTLGFPNVVDGGVNKYALQLNATNNFLTNVGATATDGHNQLYRILITDSRAGNKGYTVTGVVASDFAGPAGQTISSATLGWSPKVFTTCAAGVNPQAPTFGAGTGPVGSGFETAITLAGNACSSSGVTVQAGAQVNPGISGTTDGLKSARTLFNTVDGASNGTASATADLRIDAPTTTKAGYYTTKLVLTAL